MHTEFDNLPEPLQQQANQICNKFEAAWKQGARPSIHDFLDQCAELDRQTMLRLLIPLDVDYRQLAGDSPTEAEYCKAFPDDVSAIRQIFATDVPEESQSAGPGVTDRSVLQSLGRTLDAVPCVALRDATEEGSDPVLRPASPEIPDRNSDSRYRLDGEIARGGMGAILRGRDTDLGRDLAIKVLLDEHKMKPEVIQRFVEEAQIGGQLQHPGIAPVYELGQFADRRPFFSMKLVKGETLSKLMTGREDAAEDRGKFLGIFEHICQTMAYAHSRGVIHRDLKPANIMVGAFGEVQVMDWGLAKVLPTGGVADEKRAHDKQQGRSIIETRRSAGSDTPGFGSAGSETEMGSVMGTPAYMPPEQALGEIDNLDERADVFGLGAILCQVLTGQPPYVADDANQVYRMASRGKLEDCFHRLDCCEADAELIELAKECLAAEFEDRPPNAEAVADRVTAYLSFVQQRLKDAEVERARAQERLVAERKRRHMSLALAGSLLVLVAGVGASGTWYVQQQAVASARQTQIEDDMRQALARAQQIHETIGTQLSDMQTALALHDDASQWKAEISEALGLVLHAEKLSRSSGLKLDGRLLEQIPTLKADLQSDDRDREQAQRLEDIRLRLSTWMDGGFSYDRANREYFAEFDAEFHRHGGDFEKTDVSQLAAHLRDSTILWQWVAALDHWAWITRKTQLSPRLLELARATDPHPAWRGRLRDSIVFEDREALEQLAGEPQALEQSAVLIHVLAGRLRSVDVDAAELLRKALLRRPSDFWLHFNLGLAISDPSERAACYRAALAVRPEASAALNNLGNALKELDNVDEAIACYRKAIDIDPDHAVAHTNLGGSLVAQDKFEEAIARHRKAIEIDSDYALAHYNLGVALSHQDKLKESIACYHRAIEIDPKLARAYSGLGDALALQNKLEEAIASYHKAIEIDPDYADAHNHLGNCLLDQNKLEEAIACYLKAIEINPDYAMAHCNLGNALNRQNKRDEAIASYRKAIEIDPDLAQAHYNLGNVLRVQNKLAEAISYYRTAIDINPNYMRAYNNLALALRKQNKPQEAIACFRRAIAIDPNNAATHFNLGWAYYTQGRLDEAVASYRQAIEIDSDRARFHAALGNAFQAQNKLEEAIVCYRKYLEFDPKDAGTHYNIGRSLQYLHNLEDALTSYHKAIEIDPDFAEAWCNLGSVLREQGKFRESLEKLRRGHELGSRRPTWRSPSLRWVQLGERLVELDEKLEAVLREEVGPSGALELLDLAEFCLSHKKQYASAMRFYSEAFEAEPRHARDLRAGHRYNAACAAALASAGGGDQKPTDDQRRVWLAQARVWLQADLSALTMMIDENSKATPIVNKTLRHWQTDPNLAGVREESALTKFSPEDLAGWKKLWANVQHLLGRLEIDQK